MSLAIPKRRRVANFRLVSHSPVPREISALARRSSTDLTVVVLAIAFRSNRSLLAANTELMWTNADGRVALRFALAFAPASRKMENGS